MKEIVKIRVSVSTLTRQTELPVEEPHWAFEKIKSEFGEFVDSRTGIFQYEGEVRAKTTTKIVSLLESVGVVLIWKLYPYTPESEGHQIEGRREFDSGDVELAEYFLVQPSDEIAKAIGKPGSDGRLRFEANSPREGKEFGYAQFGGVYCSERVRAEMELRDFRGLDFRETSNPESGIFEVSSSIVLPPLLNEVVNEETGESLTPSKRRCCGIQDIFLPHQPRFPDRQLPNDFDVGRTMETWHWPTMCHVARPWIIVSKRFKNWCNESNFRIDWIPIVRS